MMALAKLFEDFGQHRMDADTQSNRASDELEEERLKSFESGYGAGWEDAIKAQTDGNRKLQDAVQQALVDMRATKQEVAQAYILSMRAVLEQIVGRVLPELADHSLAGHITSILERSVSDHGELPIEIRISPDQRAAVTRALADFMSNGVRIVGDQDLTAQQALISVGAAETKIDLDGLIGEVRAALNNFHDSVQQGG